jgi:hypothetical protein
VKHTQLTLFIFDTPEFPTGPQRSASKARYEIRDVATARRDAATRHPFEGDSAKIPWPKENGFASLQP